jgi:hypothetical protein
MKKRRSYRPRKPARPPWIVAWTHNTTGFADASTVYAKDEEEAKLLASNGYTSNITINWVRPI